MSETVQRKPAEDAAIIALRQTPPPERSRAQRWRMPLMIGVPLLLVLAAAVYFLTGGRFQETDDAYVKLARAGISASISGQVVAVEVRENQTVKAGDVLMRLDGADYEVAVQRADAVYAASRFEAEGLLATYQQRLADEAAARERVTYTEREAARQQGLAAAGVNTKGQADEAVHAAEQAVAMLRVAEQQTRTALAAIGGKADLPIDAFPNVLKANAELDQAKLNLAKTIVTAPSDGIVTKVDQVQPGTRVQPQQVVFWLVSGRPWVEANFKEDQIEHMKVGQPVTVSIDAYAGQLKGHVVSFSPGTGSSFSLLPPENATGNWVKVTQRLPVQIELEGDLPPLSAGLSATVEVDTAAP